MIFELEWLAYHARRRVVWQSCAAVVSVAAIIASFTPNYAPLTTSLSTHYLETQGRAPNQLAAQQADAAKAKQAQELEEQRLAAERSQEQAEQERARENAMRTQETQLTYSAALDEYNRLTLNLHNTKDMHDNVAGYERWKTRLASSPSFFNDGAFTIEETSSPRPCGNPQGFLQKNDDKTLHNLGACFIFLATDPAYARNHRQLFQAVTTAALLSDPSFTQRDALPVAQLIEMLWVELFFDVLKKGERSIELPELVTSSGDEMNPALMGPELNKDFANILIQQMDGNDKFELRHHIYTQFS